MNWMTSLSCCKHCKDIPVHQCVSQRVLSCDLDFLRCSHSLCSSKYHQSAFQSMIQLLPSSQVQSANSVLVSVDMASPLFLRIRLACFLRDCLMLSCLDHFAFDLQIMSFQCDRKFQFDVLRIFLRRCFQGPSVEVPQLGQGNCPIPPLGPPAKEMSRRTRSPIMILNL